MTATITVDSTTIEIGGVQIDAYTANEISSTTGDTINYLSARGLAKSIGVSETATLQNKMSKQLKSLLDKDFTVLQAEYKMTSGGLTKINLWDTVSAARFYRYHDRKGNQTAGLIIDALTSTSLDIIINDRFGRKYEKGDAERRAKLRANSKNAFWQLDAAIDHYLFYHPEMKKNLGYMIYLRSNCQDLINLGLFGKCAWIIRKELELPKPRLLRDHYTHEPLRRIDLIQSIASANIINKDVEPQTAVKEALSMMNFSVIDYMG